MSAAAVARSGRRQLSIEECRRLLGPAGERMPEEEVGRVREALYGLATVVVEGFERQGVTDRSVGNREKP
jgi:hypothetical protein